MTIKNAKEWFEKGREFEQKGDLQSALDAYRSSLKLNHKVAASWVGLASILQKNLQPEDALECLKRGVNAEPNNPIVQTKLAQAFQSLGHVESATSAYNKALEQDNNCISALLGFGLLMEDIGDAKTAANSYRQLLNVQPDNSEALSNLLGLGRHIDIEQDIIHAKEKMLASDDRSKALIGYGLGKALDNLHRYDEAFDILFQANEARKKLAGRFNRETFDKRIDDMMEIFSASFFEARKSWGDESGSLAFIVGLPRSGTTLTEQIIGAHPNCFGAGELAILTDLATGTPDRLQNNDIAWPACAPDLTASQAAQIGNELKSRMASLSNVQHQLVCDKQPLNFWHLGLVAVSCPNSYIIHCKRDIRDVGTSIYMQNFNVSQRWATDLEDIAYYWKGYKRLMKHWGDVTDLNILDIEYEDTVADVDTQARKLMAFLDLEWDDCVLDFHKNAGAVQTPSRWQVRQPIYQSSKAKWQKYDKHLMPLTQAVTD